MHAKFWESVWPMWLGIIIITVVLIGLCRLSRWFYFLTIPVSLMAILNGWGLIYHNVSFRNEMIEQLGFSYFAQFACTGALLVVALAFYAWYNFRCRQKRLHIEVRTN